MCVRVSKYGRSIPVGSLLDLVARRNLSKNTLFLMLFLAAITGWSQGPNPQTGMRVIGNINLSASCEKDTILCTRLQLF